MLWSAGRFWERGYRDCLEEKGSEGKDVDVRRFCPWFEGAVAAAQKCLDFQRNLDGEIVSLRVELRWRPFFTPRDRQKLGESRSLPHQLLAPCSSSSCSQLGQLKEIKWVRRELDVSGKVDKSIDEEARTLCGAS